METERGQSIILVVVLLTVLILFAAITVDLSWAYAMRRQMQTAADAGALAGAGELCCKCYKAAASEAVRFAEMNQAEGVMVEVDKKGMVARVTASVEHPIFFLGIFGVREMVIEASAAAECREGKVRLVE